MASACSRVFFYFQEAFDRLQRYAYSKKNIKLDTRFCTFVLRLAGLAQLVERQLPKLKVASSNLVSRSPRFRPQQLVGNRLLLLFYLLP